MAGIEFDARLDGADEAVADLEKIRERMADFRPVWREVAKIWVRRQKQIFAGKRLAPLAKSTIKRRGNHPPLVDSGRLRLSTFEDSPVKADREQAAFGIPKGARVRPLAILHASGGRRLPKRDAVPGWTAPERKEIAEIMRNYITEGLK